MALKFNPITGKLDEYGPVLTGTGTVSAAADGTAALPGIAFASDLNTGIYRPGADQLAISTNGAERVRTDSSGYLRLSATSPGIQFNGDTAAANALDDYEEGTFTPTLTSTNANTVVASYQNRIGIYTKVGNLVTISIFLATEVTTAGTGNVIVTGLPFTSSATNRSSLSLSYVGRWTTQGPLAARVASTSTTIVLEETDSAVDPNLATALSTTRLTTGAATKNVMIISGFYYA